MSKSAVSKSQAIRDYLKANPEAKPKDIAQALAPIGVTVDQVYDVRTRDSAKAAGKSPGKKGASKTSASKSTSSANALEKESKGGRGKSRPYPRSTLEEALVVPKAIREKANGNPMDTEQVAKASLGVSKTNNRFFYTAAASRDYGLTIGTRDTDQISLAPLGQEIFFAKDEETRKQKLIDAFMSIDLFRKVYEYYDGSKSIPTEGDFFGNVLVKNFQLDPEFHQEFEKIFRDNCKFLGIEAGLTPVASRANAHSAVDG